MNLLFDFKNGSGELSINPAAELSYDSKTALIRTSVLTPAISAALGFE